MTVVVTGASGHIGANLVRTLLEQHAHVRVLVHRSTDAIRDLDVEVLRGDVLHPASLLPALAGAEIVYHLAAVISISGDPHGRVRAVNVDGAENVARVALQCGVRRLVHCSSVHAFDLRSGPATIDEAAARVPRRSPTHSAYDRSKAEGERRVRALVAQGLDAVIAHPTSVIGPYDFEPSRMGRFFLRLHRRSLPSLVSGSFDFVDVRDVVDGLIAAAERGRSGESYLLSGHHHRIRDLAGVAAEITGVPPPRLTAPMWVARLGAPIMELVSRATRKDPLYTTESLAVLRPGARIDHRKATAELGHRPRPTAETVDALYRWFAERGMLTPAEVAR